MKTSFKEKLRDENISSALIIVLSNLGNFFSLLFLIFMSRNLNSDHFSLNSSLIGFVSLMTVLTTFLTPYISKFVASNSDKKFTKTYFANFIKISIYSLLVLLLLIIFKENIFDFFKFRDLKIIFICFFIFYCNVLLFYNDGFVLGNGRYMVHSSIFAFQQFSRLLILIIIVYFFYNKFSAIYATFISIFIVISIMSVFIITTESLKKTSKQINLSINFKNKDFKNSIIVQLIILYFLNIDIILSRNIFSFEISSQYIVISSLSKIIFYFFGVLLPIIVPKTIFNLKNKRNEFSYIYKIFFVIIIVYLGLIILKEFFLDFILEDIFRRENSLKKLFLYLCTVYAILSINSFLLNFFYSKKKQNTLTISLFLLIISMLFLTLINDPEELAGYMLVSVFLNFLFLVYFFFKYKNKATK